MAALVATWRAPITKLERTMGDTKRYSRLAVFNMATARYVFLIAIAIKPHG